MKRQAGAGQPPPGSVARQLLGAIGRVVAAGAALALALGLALLAVSESAPAVPAPAQGADEAQLALQLRRLWAQVRPRGNWRHDHAQPLQHAVLSGPELQGLLDQAGLQQGGRWRARVTLPRYPRPSGLPNAPPNDRPTERTSDASMADEAPAAPSPPPLPIGQLDVQLTLPLRQLPVPAAAWLPDRHLNARLRWSFQQAPTGALPPLVQARLGPLPLPPGLLDGALPGLVGRARMASLQQALGMLRSWGVSPRGLHLAWQWDRQRTAQALALLWTEADQQALRDTHRDLLQALSAAPQRGPWPLAALWQPAAQAAQARVVQGADPAVQLRALLTQVAALSVGRDLRAWVPLLQPEAALPPVELLLAGRVDMPMHFSVSVLLAWQGGARWAQALGLAKEVADTREGSGFSFNDLAGDAAGTRFGVLASQSPRAVLAQLAQGLQEPQFFPRIDDLPEYLSAQALQRDYGGLDGDGTRALRARIAARVADLPLYRAAGAAGEGLTAPSSAPP